MACRDCCEEKITKRSEEMKKELGVRLNRIEGQLRGIRKMVDNDAYCIDIVTQVSAVSSALDSLGRQILEDHIRSCVREDIRNGNEEKLEELIKTIRKMTG
ncbi:MAG: metal-sensing transcriptional repressor [Clostridiales bacterium]|nr:metal-sensing transcriptional repressor [Clostridiales bacterium]